MLRVLFFLLFLGLSFVTTSCDEGLNHTCEPDDPCPTFINYNKRLEQKTPEIGADWVNPEFTDEEYPTRETGIVRKYLEFVEFEYRVTSQEAFWEIQARGLEPARIEDMVAFGSQYIPERVWEKQIVALGSGKFDGMNTRFPTLDVIGRGTEVELTALVTAYCSGGTWKEGTRFLAVRSYQSHSEEVGEDGQVNSGR